MTPLGELGVSHVHSKSLAPDLTTATFSGADGAKETNKQTHKQQQPLKMIKI